MLTQDILLDLVVVGSGCSPGPRWHVPAPAGGSRRSKPELRLSLLLHRLHDGGLRAVVSKREP